MQLDVGKRFQGQLSLGSCVSIIDVRVQEQRPSCYNARAPGGSEHGGCRLVVWRGGEVHFGWWHALPFVCCKAQGKHKEAHKTPALAVHAAVHSQLHSSPCSSPHCNPNAALPA